MFKKNDSTSEQGLTRKFNNVDLPFFPSKDCSTLLIPNAQESFPDWSDQTCSDPWEGAWKHGSWVWQLSRWQGWSRPGKLDDNVFRMFIPMISSIDLYEPFLRRRRCWSHEIWWWWWRGWDRTSQIEKKTRYAWIGPWCASQCSDLQIPEPCLRLD